MRLYRPILALTMGILTSWACLSCGDDDNSWTPGPTNADGYVQVFFDGATKSAKTTPLNTTDIYISLSRANASDTIHVPITVISDSLFSVPDTVTFPAGVQQISVPITFTGTEVEDYYKCQLKITDPQFTSPYTTRQTETLITVLVTDVKSVTTVEDLVGSFTAISSGQEYFSYAWNSFQYTQTVTISKVDDETILMDGLYWIGSNPLTGKVDFLRQTITFEPQTWADYNFCSTAFDSNGYFIPGSNAVAKIGPDGSITFNNWNCCFDWGEGYGLYYYFYDTKTTMTKNLFMSDICGTYSSICTGSDYWDYEWVTFSYDQTVTITQGSDENTIVLNGLYWVDELPLTGTVNWTDRTITFEPQSWGTYDFCAYAWDEANNHFLQGQSVTAKIKLNGQIEITNFTATYDWGATYGLYYYLWNTVAVLTKTAQ